MVNKFEVTKRYDRERFIHFLHSFLPIDFEYDIEICYNPGSFEEVWKLGKSKSLDLLLFEVKHFKETDPRVGFTQEIIRIANEIEIHSNLLVVFHNPETEKWRFSLVTSDYSYDEKNNKLITEYSNPRRFSFILGKGCKPHTPSVMLFEKGRVKNIEDLKSRFAVEVVTKEFYIQLFDWYTWAVETSRFPQGVNDSVRLVRDDNNQQIIRLITRIMFIWFLRQLDLIPQWIFDEKELKNILKNFDPKSTTQGNYYNAILQNLFFATLNKEITERAFTNEDNLKEHFGIKTLYRDANGSSDFSVSLQSVVDNFSSVPFLNGGLFECLDKLVDDHDRNQTYVDGFSRNRERRAFVPNALFWSKEKDSKQGLIELLDRYNFTVEENTPTDIQIALDPEMLGKVFENLLGTFNPETQETARNESGSFYTPREIVNFMVDISLEEYLLNELKDFNESTIKALLDDSVQELRFKENEDKEIIEALRRCKILDPACGSGAFPMGILNRIVMLLHKIGYEPQSKNENENSTYAIKKELIEKSIYGSDIQPIAVQISKLRFFISLVCEQNKIDDASKNYGITPLPNLETKFVAANSLIDLPSSAKGYLAFEDEILIKLRNDLATVRSRHFIAKTAKEKIRLRKEDHIIRNKIIEHLGNRIISIDPHLIESYKKKIEELELEIKRKEQEEKPIIQEALFAAERPESISGSDTLDLLKKSLRATKDAFVKDKNRKMSDGQVKLLQSLVDWNPYDQNGVSSFFDPQWIFGENVKHGFDIVIGNPPYIELEKNSGELANLYENCGFKSFARRGDVYCLFYEKGNQLLRNNGHLCYITSNKWMRAGYGKKLRNYFINNTNPKLLIDFGGVKVFASATVDTNILLFEKDDNTFKTRTVKIDKHNEKAKNLKSFIGERSLISSYKDDNVWAILSKQELEIKQKIEAIGKPLKEWNIRIGYGIKTGYNKAFIIDGATKDRLIKEDPNSAEIIKPILRGRDIKRYKTKFADLWLIYATWKIQNTNIPEKYPAIHKYLLQFKGKNKLGDNSTTKVFNRPWWSLMQEPTGYYEDFEKEKIIYPNMTKYLPFVYDTNKFYTNQKCFILTSESVSLKYLIGFLNSKISQYWIRRNCPELLGGTRELSKIFFELIPIPNISTKEQKLIINLVDEM